MSKNLIHLSICIGQNQYYFCFSKNHSQPKPAEQLLSLNDLFQQNIDDVYIDGIDDVK